MRSALRSPAEGRRRSAPVWVVRSLAAAGLVLVFLALVAGYLQRNVFDPEQFGDNAVEALRTDAVRTSLAESVTVPAGGRGAASDRGPSAD